MGKPKLLLTGATGHIGFRTLVFALEAGYSVRTTIRRPDQEARIKEATSIVPFLDDLEFVQVPDITASDAYNQVFGDIDYALHLASPIPDFTYDGSDWDSRLYQPAVQGTLNLLRAAARTPSVKRVVITSTIAILETPAGLNVAGPNELNSIARSGVPAQAKSQFEAYGISKSLAYAAAARFMNENRVRFDLITLFPGNVIGANELNVSQEDVANSSNYAVIDIARGQLTDGPGQVFLDDVAKAHILVLDSQRVPKAENFILVGNSGQGFHWDEVTRAIAELYPEQVATGLLRPRAGQKDVDAKYGTRATEEILGIGFSGLEVMVKSALGQYLALPKSA